MVSPEMVYCWPPVWTEPGLASSDRVMVTDWESSGTKVTISLRLLSTRMPRRPWRAVGETFSVWGRKVPPEVRTAPRASPVSEATFTASRTVSALASPRVV